MNNFIHCCKNNQLYSLSTIKRPNFKKREDGMTGFAWACFKRHFDTVKYLISKFGYDRADPFNEYNQNGFIVALQLGYTEIVTYILMIKPLMIHHSLLGPLKERTPFELVCENGHIDIVKMLSPYVEDKHNALLLSVINNQNDIVTFLSENMVITQYWSLYHCVRENKDNMRCQLEKNTKLDAKQMLKDAMYLDSTIVFEYLLLCFPLDHESFFKEIQNGCYPHLNDYVSQYRQMTSQRKSFI